MSAPELLVKLVGMGFDVAGDVFGDTFKVADGVTEVKTFLRSIGAFTNAVGTTFEEDPETALVGVAIGLVAAAALSMLRSGIICQLLTTRTE